MAINVSQAFKRTSANPVDETLTLTKAQMLATNDNLMPSKYLTVCQDDGFIYLYDKSATPNQTTGKFTKFEGGGSSATDYIPVVSSLPTPSQEWMGKFVFYTGNDTTTASGLVLRYGTVYKCTNDPDNNIVWMANGNSIEGYVKSDDAIELTATVPAIESGDMRARLNLRRNTTPTSGSTLPITSGAVFTALAGKQDKLVYSTSEQAIGTWINGSTLYQRTYTGTFPSSGSDVTLFSVSGMYVKDVTGYCLWKSGDTNFFKLPSSYVYNSKRSDCSFYVHNGNFIAGITDGNGYIYGRSYVLTITYTK